MPPTPAIDAGFGHVDLLVVRVRRGAGVGGVEEPLAQRVGDARAGEPLVQQHRTIGHCFVQFLQRRVAVLGPLVGVPAAHRRDPLAVGHALAARRQGLLDLANRGRVLERRVVARPVRQADDVHVRLDEPRHHRAAAQVDAASRGARRRRVAGRDDAAAADGDATHHGGARIHRVDAPVHQHQIVRGWTGGRCRRCLLRLGQADGRTGRQRRSGAGGCGNEASSRGHPAPRYFVSSKTICTFDFRRTAAGAA